MTNKKNKIEPYKVLNYAGAFIALLIGSGFATGQEIIQYFSSWGWWGVAGVVTVFLLMTYVGVSFVSAGFNNKFENPNDIYKYYCGNVIGTFYDYFSVFFLFLSYIVMVAGAGATFEQHYALNPSIGSILLMFLAIGTVVFGLGRIVDVIGNIGPVIVVMAIFVGLFSIFTFIGQAPLAPSITEEAIKAGEIKVASSSWILAAGSYVGFCMLWLAAFLGQIGSRANSELEGRLGAFFGSLGFSLATAVMAIGLFFAMSKVKGSQVPGLVLAGEIHPVLATVFSIIIFAGIFTTAVPLLWTVVSRFAKEKTPKFRLLTVILGVIGAIAGITLSFDVLVNYVYVINGYIGLALLGIMIVRTIQWKRI